MAGFTVGDLLNRFPPNVCDANDTATPSQKPWTGSYHPFSGECMTVYEATRETVERFLGPGNYPSTADYLGLATPANPPNLIPQNVLSEADVSRDFDQNIAPGIALAFSGPNSVTMFQGQLQQNGPELLQRSMSKPPSSLSSKNVDWQLEMLHPHSRNIKRAAVVGEMKKPRSLIVPQWTGQQPIGSVTDALMREIRGYAYIYKCPQAFYYDSKVLLLIQFHAGSPDEIKDPNCRIDICVIQREQRAPNQCTMQYGLYRLAWRGWVRLCATQSSINDEGKIVPSSTSLESKSGVMRKYRFYSGLPIWTNSDESKQSTTHPDHQMARREFRWVSPQGGAWGWYVGMQWIGDDTGNCLVHAYWPPVQRFLQ